MCVRVLRELLNLCQIEGALPAPGKQDRYDIDVGAHTVYDLLEEWLEASDRS